MVHDNGEQYRTNKGEQIADGADVIVKGDHINTHHTHYGGMEQLAKRQAENTCNYGQHKVFFQHVAFGFLRVESKHLHGGNLTAALCNVDVGKVKDNDKYRSCFNSFSTEVQRLLM